MIIEIPMKVYPFTLILSINDSKKEVKRFFKENKLKCKHDCFIKNSDAIFIKFANNQFFIRIKNWKNKSKQIGLLSHELLHCTFSVMNEIGVRYSDESEEAYTYFFQYLLEQSLKEIEKIFGKLK